MAKLPEDIYAKKLPYISPAALTRLKASARAVKSLELVDITTVADSESVYAASRTGFSTTTAASTSGSTSSASITAGVTDTDGVTYYWPSGGYGASFPARVINSHLQDYYLPAPSATWAPPMFLKPEEHSAMLEAMYELELSENESLKASAARIREFMVRNNFLPPLKNPNAPAVSDTVPKKEELNP